MRLQRYFPSRIAEQVLWLLSFADNLPKYRQELGLSDDALASLVADARFAAYTLGSWLSAVRHFSDAATAAVAQTLHGSGANGLPVFTAPPLPDGVPVVADGALERIFRAVRAAKFQEHYTDTIGTDLGLIPKSENTNRTTPRFKLKAVRIASGPAVEIGFSKYSHAAVWIESRRAGGEPEGLGIAVSTPWTDQRPLLVPGQPETREYRLRYWEDSAPTGEWTPWRMITVPA